MADGDSYLGYARASGHSIYIPGICSPSYEGLIRAAIDNSQGTNGMEGLAIAVCRCRLFGCF